MAKLALTVAVVCGLFFFFFAFSHARTPADLPGADVIAAHESPNNRPESDLQTATLLLPSERSDSESATFVDFEPGRANSKIPGSDPERVDTVPLTVISFRPINRHFPRRPFPLTFRRGHPCRHGHPQQQQQQQQQRQFKPWGPRPQSREIFYGNDAIVADDLRFKPVFHDEHDEPQHHFPARLVRFREGGPRFPFGHDHPQHHRHHHLNLFRHRNVEAERENEERDEAEHKHHHGVEGFMKRVRKFLYHHF